MTTTDTPIASFKLDPKNLADIGGRLLSTVFMRNERDKAKRLYKEIKHGKQPNMGDLTLGEGGAMPLRLALDYSEFRGPFSFPAFQAAVHALLGNLSKQMQEEGKHLQTFSSEDANSLLFAVPGAIAAEGGQYNVLMMSFEIGNDAGRKPGLLLKLMFVDPEQFMNRQTQKT